MTIEVRVKLWRHDARIPTYAKDDDACVDLCAGDEEDVTVVYPGKTQVVYTAMSVAIPSGYEGVIRPRSGLSSKLIEVQMGTIDAGYRGRIGVIVHNASREPFAIKRNDRIAQLAIREAPRVRFLLVDALEETARGESGFGSTGV